MDGPRHSGAGCWRSVYQLPHAKDAQAREGMAVVRVMVVVLQDAKHVRNVAVTARGVNFAPLHHNFHGP